MTKQVPLKAMLTLCKTLKGLLVNMIYMYIYLFKRFQDVNFVLTNKSHAHFVFKLEFVKARVFLRSELYM